MKSKIIESQRRQQDVNEQYRSFPLMLICVVPLSLMLAAGCKKTEATPPAAEGAAAQPGAAQPTAAPSAAAPANPTPAAAAKPVPSFSAAEKIGMFVYPKSNQTHDQQLIDEAECYNTVQQQTGINPQAGGPQAPSAADVSAAQEQGAADADEAKGGRAKGAAKGALGGAAIGAISGNAGRGAAIGAGVGTVRGGRKQRKANEASEQAGAEAAVNQQQQAYDQSKAAHNQQIGTFKRGFSACMDARNYSVK